MFLNSHRMEFTFRSLLDLIGVALEFLISVLNIFKSFQNYCIYIACLFCLFSFLSKSFYAGLN